MLLVGYAGFCRMDEVLSLTMGNICIFEDHMSIFMPKRKNDQYREGHTSLIYRSKIMTCPVGIAERNVKGTTSNVSR